MANRITDERLREIATSDPLVLAISAQMGEPSWADVRAIAAELLAARADLREAVELLRAYRRDRHTIADWEPIWERADELVEKHKETP